MRAHDQSTAEIRRYRSEYERRLQSHFCGRGLGFDSRYEFTDDPVKLPAGHFGLGLGNGGHAPNEYCVIEGLDGAVRSHIDFLYELANVSLS